MAKEGYKDHRPGVAKGEVHKAFDEKGKDAAIKKAAALGLADATARTWCSQWGKGAGKAKKAAAKTAPKKAVKAAPKKAAAKKAVKRPARKAAAESHATA